MPSKKKNEEMRFVFDGEIRFEHLKDGKVVDSSVMDDVVVQALLQHLIDMLERALDDESIMAAVAAKAKAKKSKRK